MIALLQRVRWSRVTVDDEVIAGIGPGLLVFLGVEAGDGEAEADRLIGRIVRYRVFADGEGRMNRSLLDIGGDLLLVPQFTLAADTRKGLRPGFSGAAAPGPGRRVFECALARARALTRPVACGRFGADMQIDLCNDGPVTFLLRTG